MKYSFLEEFPIVTYKTRGDGNITIWIYPRNDLPIYVEEVDISDVIKNKKLFEMCYPHLGRLAAIFEDLFVSSELNNEAYYWVNNWGDWGYMREDM